MTAVEVAGIVLTAFSAALFAPAIVARHRARRRLRAALLDHLRSELTRITAERDQAREQRDHAQESWLRAQRQIAALTEHIGDERRAAAYQALTDAPAFFDTAARQSLDWLDAQTWPKPNPPEGKRFA